MKLVFKIFRQSEWGAFVFGGETRGSADDLRDGYIHLSTADQVAGTAERHFAGEHGLMLAAFDAAALGPALRWEPSRGGALFPHLHGILAYAAVHWAHPLDPGPDGAHVIPALDP